MSRSKRKHPFCGLTTCESEKDDKRRAHQRERHAVRQTLQGDPLCEILPHWYEFSDPWGWGKDGKSMFWAKWNPKRLRK